ncbi:MAG: hypothetical protein HY679_11120 [Chloroflexi bacterium]|nr:hypothetical protein [Chloroflexota bacterium]
MSFLNQAFSVITSPNGSAIYHIVTLFALEAAFAIALGYRRRAGRTANTTRLAIAAGVGGAGRLVLFALGALGLSGLFSAPAILAPLDRAFALITLLLLGWSLVFRAGKRRADLALGAALVAVVIAYIAIGIQWYPLGAAGAPYNSADIFWELAKLAVILLSLLGLLHYRPEDWGLALGLFAALLAGVAYHLISPIPTDNYPAPERIAELAALPLLAVIVYRHALGGPVAAPEAARPASVSVPILTSESKVSLTVPAATALIEAGITGDGQDLVSKLAKAAGKTMLADLTLLFAPPAPNGVMACAGGYDLIRELTLPGFPLPVNKVNILASAVSRGRPARLRPPTHQSELSLLAHALNLSQVGSALLAPIKSADGRNFGSVAVFSAYARKDWSNEDHTMLAALADAMATVFAGNERTNTKALEFQRLQGESGRRLEEALTESRSLRQRLTHAEFDLQEARNQARRDRLQAESLTAIMQAEAAQSATGTNPNGELAALRDNYNRALDEMAALNEQLAAAQSEVETLHARLAGASAPAAAGEAELTGAAAPGVNTPALQVDYRRALEESDALREQLHGAQSQIARLTDQLIQARLADTGIAGAGFAAELALLQEQLAGAKLEVEQLRARLQDIESVPAGASPETQSQSAVIVSLAQDLRQPMSSILGYTDLLLGESVGILGALQRTFLDRIKASTQRMGAVLDDLIRVTAIDAGELQLERQSIEIAEVIEDSFTSVSTQFREKGTSLRMDIADDLPTIEADRDAIHQIISQLLTNACTASPPNSEVVLSAQPQSDDYLLISVRDFGGGISPEDQGRVFARLHRADRPLIQGLGDTGVGLSIAKALTEAQGGRIWVNSDIGSGSTFSVLLPVTQPAPARTEA